MKYKRHSNAKGMVLIIVLLLVTAITIVALGFIVRGDTELLFGQNMELKADMDYITESGLAHARGILLAPQDTAGEFWTGAAGCQLVSGSSDYYDVNVSQLSTPFDYQITSSGYRQIGGQVTAQQSLTAKLRFNPAVVFWVGSDETIPSQMVIDGDVHCQGNLSNFGYINGDAYASGSVVNAGTLIGQRYPSMTVPPVSLPNISAATYNPQYYYNGAGPYSALTVSGIYTGTFPGPGAGNPGRVYYCSTDLTLKNTINITGTLVVGQDLLFEGGLQVTITPLKGMPAVLVGRDIKITTSSQSAIVTGYVQIGNALDMGDKAGSSVTITGALYIPGDGVENALGAVVRVNGAPQKAALAIWSNTTTIRRWSPAGGAFYRSITRNP